MIASIAGAAAIAGPAALAGGETTGAGGCPVAKLGAALTLIPGSQGAGQVHYRLKVTNHAGFSCVLTSPVLKLRGQSGQALPSHSSAGASTHTLAAGRAATADVAFTPDVAASGEHQTGACEPAAHTFTLTLAGEAGATRGPVKPPTPVCQHGRMSIGPWQ